MPDSERNSGRRAAALEEESKKAQQAQRDAEAERRLAERERQERTAECLSWRERHGELAERFRAQEDLKALRQNKAVRKTPLRDGGALHLAFLVLVRVKSFKSKPARSFLVVRETSWLC